MKKTNQFSSSPIRILTFDVEEWFHLLDHPFINNEKNWMNLESRIEENMERIIEMLCRNHQKATFFVLGWIADQYPQLIKKLHKLGYEIGLHSYAHQLIHKNDRTYFIKDLNRSIQCIQNITGNKIKIHRASGFSLTEQTKWVFEELLVQGIEVDCSIFPAQHSHGGYPSFPISKPCLININGHYLKEFPMNTITILNQKFIFSGGGYFRILPYLLIKYFTKKSDYTMSYFHPRDMDINQPLISDLSLSRKFKSYIGLGSCQRKLEKWINNFTFVDIKTAEKHINWNNIFVVNL